MSAPAEALHARARRSSVSRSGARPPASEASANSSSASDEHPALAEVVGGAPAEHQEAGERDRVGVDDPLQLGRGEAEARLDRGQRDVDDAQVEDDHELRDAADDQQPRRARAQTAPGRLGRHRLRRRARRCDGAHAGSAASSVVASPAHGASRLRSRPLQDRPAHGRALLVVCASKSASENRRLADEANVTGRHANAAGHARRATLAVAGCGGKSSTTGSSQTTPATTSDVDDEHARTHKKPAKTPGY